MTPERTAAGAVTVHKRMSITHADFRRILPGAVAGRPVRTDGNRIVIDDAGRHLEITLSEERTQRIALLALPVTDVRLEFVGYSAPEAAAALARFERAFQRGGG